LTLPLPFSWAAVASLFATALTASPCVSLSSLASSVSSAWFFAASDLVLASVLTASPFASPESVVLLARSLTGLPCELAATAVRAPAASNPAAAAAIMIDRSMKNPPWGRDSCPLERRCLDPLTGERVSLLSFEVWLLFADKGHDSHHRVLGHRRPAEVFGFDLVPFARGAFQARQQRLLRQPQGDRRRPGKPASPRKDRLVKSFGRKRRRDQADAGGLGRLEPDRLEDQLGGPAAPDQAGQPLRPAGARDQPQVGFRLPDRRAAVIDHQPVVAGKRQLAAAAERMAVDGRDQRLGEMFDFGEGRLAAARHLRHPFQRRRVLAVETAFSAHGLDIRTGHEIAIDRAGQDDHARSVVLLQPPQRLDEFLL